MVIWAAAVTAALSAIGLTAVTVVVDLDTGDRIASIVGAVLAGAGLVVSVLALSASGSGTARAGGFRRVRAQGGGVAAGGDIRGNAMGRGARAVAPASGPRPPVPPQVPTGADVQATGTGSVAASGEVSGNAIGEGSEIR